MRHKQAKTWRRPLAGQHDIPFAHPRVAQAWLKMTQHDSFGAN